jgi:hypothetical protein
VISALDTNWTVRESNSSGSGGFHAQPVSCTVDAWSFPGVKRPGRGPDHPPSSSDDVANELKLYIRLPSVPAYACHWVALSFYLHTEIRTLSEQLRCPYFLESAIWVWLSNVEDRSESEWFSLYSAFYNFEFQRKFRCVRNEFTVWAGSDAAENKWAGSDTGLEKLLSCWCYRATHFSFVKIN